MLGVDGVVRGSHKGRSEHGLAAQGRYMVFFSLSLGGEYIRLAFWIASWRGGIRVNDVCAGWLGSMPALFWVSERERAEAGGQE